MSLPESNTERMEKNWRNAVRTARKLRDQAEDAKQSGDDTRFQALTQRAKRASWVASLIEEVIEPLALGDDGPPVDYPPKAPRSQKDFPRY